LAPPGLSATLGNGMSARTLALLTLLTFPLACGGTHSAGSPEGTVARVLDGDTIVLTDGRHVRLVQLDAPEIDENECYSEAGKRALARLLPLGTHVEIETDPALDQVDRYGRTLAYVRRGSVNINLELVRAGAASVWFYDGDRGRYAGELLATARRAQLKKRGLWGACPGTVLDPLHSVEARP
jgi:endonuclease YncB( thermonuclease family)